MKYTILTYLLTSLALIATPFQIKLDKPEVNTTNHSLESEIDNNHETQIITSFKKALSFNDGIRAAFKPTLDKATSIAGDSLRAVTASPITVSTLTFRTKEGKITKTKINRTIVIFYAFGGESIMGSDIVAGVFAIFKVSGTYSSSEDKLLDHSVVAEFKGFQDKLTVKQIISAQEDQQNQTNKNAEQGVAPNP